MQNNGYDCGVWVLAQIFAMFKGFGLTAFAEEDLPAFRLYLASLFGSAQTST